MDTALKTLLLGCAIGTGIACTTILTGLGCCKRSIPYVEEVQEGYIAPNKLKVECKDLDSNGELETIIRVGEIPYLLREVDGKPVLSEYRVYHGITIIGKDKPKTFPYKIEHLEVNQK